MILRRISLRNFRNYADLSLQFSESCNFFVGDNAQGKSNLLEAVHVLGLTRGFRTNVDRDLVRLGCAGYEISGEFIDELQVRHVTVVCYDGERGKETSLDRKHISTTGWVGKFPIVLFSPECHKITSGPPSERRRFVDMLLCQSSPAYLADLVEYNRVLRQRNALLAQLSNSHATDLLAWSQALAVFGCRISLARLKFVKEYEHILAQSYQHISGSSLPFTLTYRTQFPTEEITPEKFLQLLQQTRSQEERRKRTLVGPQQDELSFEIAGKDLRKFGSRGEQKTALVALKLAETFYLKQRTGTAPIILLDDLTSELDQYRLHSARDYFQGHGQLFITSTAPMSQDFGHLFESFRITNGILEPLVN